MLKPIAQTIEEVGRLKRFFIEVCGRTSCLGCDYHREGREPLNRCGHPARPEA